ncbi:hypothetical protein [Williamsia sterculiae]|uniref:Uncharacterized protein n=1 Tax=Williamsia sterculiae TaxID=1344003 RepID=A0A1N7DKI9_9NOCA|nr:hypothetical protein [Williamsia sterculiae]SIR76255.1 hypothetical protein SAMN05445060_0704 [Williamsia sterculiae]
MKRTVVECSQGARYATLWWPLGSFNAVRLGGVRIQRCPVHHRWERTRRVDPAALSLAERRAAESIRDIGII